MGAANPTGAARHARHVLAFGDEPRNPISEILDLGDIDSVSETWDLLLKHVEVFTKIVSRFSEIHPYAKFACSVLTMAQKVIFAQQERDDKFRELIKITTDVFCFLNELKVAALEGHRQTIMLLTLQTTECAYFIRDYTKQKRSFIIRAAKNVISGDAIERKIAEYEKKFQDLKVAFRDGAALNIEIAVVRIAEQVDRIATAGELDDLPYAQGARFDLRKQCLLGTREELLEKIFEWVNNADVDTPRVLVLNGVAGSGKSAIAHSVSRRFNEMRRLGSSFFFLPDRPERSPDKLFSTITRDLADLDPQWKEALKQNIGARAVRNTSCVLEQFEEFIIKPAASSVYFGPVVIVIDALDATGDPSMRKDLVSLLSMRTADFPSNFRILITARPEPDICHAFNDQKGVHWWDIQKVVDKQSTLDDIADFFDSELSDFAGLKWSERYCRKMTTKSEGDFGWAAFACAFIKELGAAQPPSERMSQLLSRPKGITVDDEDVSDVDCQGSFAFFRDKLHIPHLGPGAHKPSNAHGNSHLNPHVALKDPGPGLGFPAPLLPSNGQGPHGPWYFPGSGHPY
ncbi:hypothetical protein C8R44DRAFT_608581 [Mycena epipterygia]|nr:hypothetical protein C8R44DRAFT_608581 [Mycena epipterygia]